MNHHLTTVLLAPILIVQGRYVRRVTPKLPEPAGIRCGISGTGPITSLLIVGDSAAAGVGVETQEKALSGQLLASLGSTHSVSWKLLAHTGDASGHVLARLESVSAEVFDSVLISLGVNDVTARTGTRVWVKNLQCIIDVLKNRFQARRIFLSSVPPMHRFPALPQPLRWWLGARARRLNQLMKKIAEDDASCRFVSVPFPIEKDVMAEDGFHPGASAYELWGRHVAKIIQAELCAENS